MEKIVSSTCRYRIIRAIRADDNTILVYARKARRSRFSQAKDTNHVFARMARRLRFRCLNSCHRLVDSVSFFPFVQTTTLFLFMHERHEDHDFRRRKTRYFLHESHESYNLYSKTLYKYLRAMRNWLVRIPFSRHALTSSFKSIRRLLMSRVLAPPVLIVTKSFCR